MPNILTVPASGIISFDSRTGTDFNLPNLENSVRIAYDSNGGLNINSYVTGVSGVERFSIDGANGRLFSVTDSLSGLLFSVNDIAGLPIIEAFDNDTVIMGAYNRNDLIITGNSVGIGALPNTGTQKLFVSGNFAVSGTSTFSVRPTVNGTGVLLSGEAANLPTTIVYTTGDQTITGLKTFDTIIANHFSGGQFSGPAGSNLLIAARGTTALTFDGNEMYMGRQLNGQGNNLYNFATIGFGNVSSVGDAVLARDQANVIAQRRGLNPQQFRVYNLTGTNSGEFGAFGWQATGPGSAPNALVIGAQATQSGILRNVVITGNSINIQPSGGAGITVDSRGRVTIRQNGVSDFTNSFAVRNPANNLDYFRIRDDGSSLFANQGVTFDGTSINAAVRNGAIVVAQQNAANQGFFGWSKTNDPFNNLANDVTTRLYRGGDFELDLRNPSYPTSGHRFRIFNVSGTNTGEFATIGWSGTGSASTFIIAPQSTQSGSNRNLEIHAAGFGRRIIVANNGHVGIGTSAGDQTSHGIWVNPAAGQTSITHGAGQVYVNNLGVMFNSNTRVFNNNAFTFGISQNSTIPMIQGSTGILPNIQVRSSDGLIFGGLDAAQLRVYGTTGVGGTSGEFGFFGWTTGSGISPTFVVGPQQTNSGILRDLTITGANINIIPYANITFNHRPLVSGIPVSLIGDDSAAITGLDNKINSLSGNATVLRYGDQIIDGIKTFRDTVYIKDLYVTGAETIVNTTVNNVQDPFLLLNLTGGALDGGIFFVTGVGLTGVNDYGPIIGYDNNNKFKFGVARRSDDLSVLNDIASVQDFTNYSGFINTNLQKLEIALPIGIDMYTGTFNTTFSATPTVVATIRATGLFNYVTTLVSTTTSGFVTDFSDVIEENGVTLNIIAYNNF